jgi:hypothetical protein
VVETQGQYKDVAVVVLQHSPDGRHRRGNKGLLRRIPRSRPSS